MVNLADRVLAYVTEFGPTAVAPLADAMGFEPSALRHCLAPYVVRGMLARDMHHGLNYYRVGDGPSEEVDTAPPSQRTVAAVAGGVEIAFPDADLHR